ncbi:hypothetical protein Hanom_Chr16g01459121 [Helianthus anomalus]
MGRWPRLSMATYLMRKLSWYFLTVGKEKIDIQWRGETFSVWVIEFESDWNPDFVLKKTSPFILFSHFILQSPFYFQFHSKSTKP